MALRRFRCGGLTPAMVRRLPQNTVAAWWSSRPSDGQRYTRRTMAPSLQVPPLEATRNICSSVMSRSIAVGQCTKDDDVILAFFDISRAHPHVEMKRHLFVELPLEHTEHAKLRVGRLRRHLHGVPDAGQNFGLKVQEVVEGAVAKIGRDNPCVFSKIVGGWGELSFLHHCDDFILAGRLTVVFETVDTIRGTFIVKV